MAKKKNAQKKLSPEDAMMMGFGLAAFAKDRFDDLVEFMVKEAKLAKNTAQAKSKLKAMGKKEYAAMMQRVEKSADKAMKEALKTMKQPVAGSSGSSKSRAGSKKRTASKKRQKK